MCFMTLFSPLYWNCMLDYEKPCSGCVYSQVLIFAKWSVQYFSNNLLAVLMIWFNNLIPESQQLELTLFTTVIKFIVQSLSKNIPHLFIILLRWKKCLFFQQILSRILIVAFRKFKDTFIKNWNIFVVTVSTSLNLFSEIFSVFIHQWLYSSLSYPGRPYNFVILYGRSAGRKAATYTHNSTNTE
jgi:hypothetical protein